MTTSDDKATNGTPSTSTNRSQTTTTVAPNPTSGSSVAPNTNAVVAVSPAAGSVAATSPPSRKRKAVPPVPAPVPAKQSDPAKKETIIDDEVACTVFRDLGLDDDFLSSGKVLAWALQPDDEDFINIHDYVANSQGNFGGVKILSILRILPKANNLSEHQLDFNEDPNAKNKLRMMLWHGTPERNVASILQNGLLLPTRYPGGAIYFADRVDKSRGYCRTIYPKDTGYLFLCDVLLGTIYQPYSSTSCDRRLPSGYDSIKLSANRVPDSQKKINGCLWPLGPTVTTMFSLWHSLEYNEYLVYNANQVQPKYLVKVQLVPKPHFDKLR